ncbi:hypothetical protein [Ensifer sp. 4252]|uniref:hypothetical protein n=1 Tax=Ensifer sp. 4252 TaxID=3373915 RepID=UPI003D207C07
MKITAFLNSLMKAPFLAIIAAILGFVFSALIVLTNFVVHFIAGAEHGIASDIVTAVAKHLPIVLGVLGFFRCLRRGRLRHVGLRNGALGERPRTEGAGC